MTDSIDWRAKASALASELDFLKAIDEVLPHDALPPETWPRPWIVACSGGADSTALLLCLVGQFPDDAAAGHITVAHFNHGTRGDESNADAAFVQEMARGLGLPCRLGLWQDFAQPADPVAEEASEEVLRDGRERFFSDVEPAGVPCLRFMGHQRDDVVETLLMAVSRGSHPSGMATGPLPWSCRAAGRCAIVRPLLSRSRKAIQKALSKLAIPWREDASNQSDRHLRNRLRQQVVPAWVAAADRDPRNGAAVFRRSLHRLSESHRFLLGLALDALFEGFDVFDFGKVSQWPWSAKHELLATWLKQQGEGRFYPDTAMVEALLKAGTAKTTLIYDVTPAERVVVTQGRARLEQRRAAPPESKPSWSRTLLMPGEHVSEDSGRRLSAETIEVDEALRASIVAGRFSNTSGAFLDEAECRGLVEEGALGLLIRSWQTGDRYQPLNAPGSATLQDLFVNHKIPPRERRRLPVVCVGGQIVWVPGLPPAHALRIRPGSRRALRLTYQVR